MHKSIFFIAMLLFGAHAYTQTGPGGVGDNTTNLLWVDATFSCLNNSLNAATNNQGVKRILDFSGNNNFLNQSNSVRHGLLITNQINGRSVIRFDGNNDQYIGSLSAGTISEITIFTVGNFDLATQPAGNSDFIYLLGSSNNSSVNFGRSNANSGVNADKYYSRTEGINRRGQLLDNSVHLYTQRFESTTPFHFFNVDGSAQVVDAHNSIVTVSSSLQLGTVYGGNTNNFDGDLAELIAFESINRTQTIIVENYLAAKYNLAMGANDFYAFKATHGNEVAGIGQESATDNHTTARGTSIVQITGADDLEDGEYMLWGHDGAGTGSNSTEIPASYLVTNGERLDQEWRVDISGGDLSLGTFDITFDMTGIGFGIDQDEYRLLVDTDNDGDFTDATVNGTLPTIIGGSVTFSGVTLADGNFFTIGNSNDLVLCVSLTTGTWQTVVWDCGSPPDSTNNVEISDGTNVTIALGTEESANDLTIREDAGGGGGNLILSPNSTLIVQGTFEIRNGASLAMAAGSRIIFRGVNGNQTIVNTSGSALSFANVEINNVNGATLFAADYEISENLDLLNGNLTNNGNLTFLSTATNTAAIGRTPNSNIIDGTGTFTVQRFRSSRTANWGDIASSGVDTDLEDLNGEVAMSGIVGGNGYAFAQGGGSFTSVYFWDENANAYAVPTSTAEPFELGRGYEIWLADNLSTWGDQAWELEGDIDLSPISISVSSGGTGWNLLGNPYLGFLNFDNIDAAGGIVGNEYWYVDANTSTFISVPAGGATIPPGQGFWINASGISSIDLDPASDLVSGTTSSIYLKRNIKNDELRIMAHHSSEPDGSAVYLRRDENSYEGLDYKDLSPLRLPNPNASELSIVAGSADLMVTYIPTASDLIEIPIRFETGIDGDYELSFEGISSFEGYSCASIRDDENNVTPILDEGVYQINNLKENDVLHYTLILAKDGMEDCIPQASQNDPFQYDLVKIWDNLSIVNIDFSIDQSSMADIEVYDVLGNVIHSSTNIAEYNRVEIPLTNETSGVYFVSVTINGENWTQKIIKY